ncbi:hypothetical protein CMEL01_13682 [Colletotrichum melonis]|uniref:Uncharacterized protein n=2 Tax=Colletotrichum acutatum species complex TaxID=2707335 RepID=A0AAI9UQ06_9PEZI|nr:hypothetical protein CMEL01_13682 [Colletotrichum melonis]
MSPRTTSRLTNHAIASWPTPPVHGIPHWHGVFAADHSQELEYQQNLIICRFKAQPDESWAFLAADTKHLQPVSSILSTLRPPLRRSMRLCRQCQDLRGWVVSPWLQLSPVQGGGDHIASALHSIRGEAIKTRPLTSLGIAPFTLPGRHMHSICAIFLHGHHPLAVPPEGSPMCHEPDEPANATGIYQAFRRNLGCTTPERENDRTISNMTARTPQMQLQTTMTLSSFEPSSTLELSTFGRSYSRLNQTTVFASPDDRDNPGSSRTSGPPKSPRCGGSNGVLVFGRQAEIRKDSASGVLARRDQAKMPVGLLA